MNTGRRFTAEAQRAQSLAEVFSANLGLLCASAVAILASAQTPDYRVKPKFAQQPDIRPVLERVEAANDVWAGEKDFETIVALLGNPRSFPALAPVLTRFAKLDLAEFKIIATGRAGDQARLKLRVELGGVTPDGRLLSLLGHADTIWTGTASQWNLGPLREATTPRRWFTDVTAQAIGLNRSFTDQLAKGVDHWRSTLDAAVGVDVYGHNGLAVGDYDGDGLEDLYVCQPAGLPNRLYRNNGDGTFTDATRAAGLDILDATSMALFADVDNDGDQDLIVIVPTQPLLFRNDGRGRFRLDAASGFGAAARRGATLTGAAVADYDRDGDLDLYVCAYDFWRAGSPYDAPTPYYDATNGPPNTLFRNRGDGAFEDVTEKAGLMHNNDRFSFAAAWGDYNQDGYPDLWVANDFGRKNLYRNNRDGAFTDVAAEAGVQDLGAGMSAAWSDFDGDGRPDLYAGNMWSSAGQRLTGDAQFRGVAADPAVRAAFQRQARGNSLFRNNGDGTFADVSLEAGVEMGRWAWSSDFLDINNDGREDLYVTNGYLTGADQRDL